MLADEVAKAAARPEVTAAVAALYDDLQQDIDDRKPGCSASGRCCRFDEYGHRLYVTTIELAAFVHALGQRSGTASDGCPFQRDGLCTVHTIRPFGCRIFFCDETSTGWQHDRYEHYHARLKRMHAGLNVPYHYLEWRQALKGLGLPIDSPIPSHATAKRPLSLPQLPF